MFASFENAVETLKSGQPLIFPTDTVWGIGAAVRYCGDPRPLVEAKGRDGCKPVAWLVPRAEALLEYGAGVPGYAMALARHCWPGALTIVVKASEDVPLPYRSKEATIGLRMPDSPVARLLMEAVGSPLATTSANLAGADAVPSRAPFDPDSMGLGGIPVLRAEEVPAASRCAAAPDAPAASQAASAVVDCTGPEPQVLRRGPMDPRWDPWVEGILGARDF